MVDRVEEWRSIHGGFYEVSNFGNVRRARAGTSTFIGRPVLPVVSPGGYLQVQLCGGGKNIRAYVHALVAEAFIGAGPSGYVVNHRDCDKQNNQSANLEYVTPGANAGHALGIVVRRKGPSKPKTPLKGKPVGDRHWTKRLPDRIARGSRMPHCKLSKDSVAMIRSRAALGEKQIALAREFGISISQTSRIVRGVRWTYL